MIRNFFRVKPENRTADTLPARLDFYFVSLYLFLLVINLRVLLAACEDLSSKEFALLIGEAFLESFSCWSTKLNRRKFYGRLPRDVAGNKLNFYVHICEAEFCWNFSIRLMGFPMFHFKAFFWLWVSAELPSAYTVASWNSFAQLLMRSFAEHVYMFVIRLVRNVNFFTCYPSLSHCSNFSEKNGLTSNLKIKHMPSTRNFPT